MTDHQEIFSFPARIRAIDLRAEGLELPDGIENPFIFETESSNNSLDFYFTHMLESTLRNFVADAADGVQFLDSHNARNLGYGRTIGGRYEEDPSQQPNFALPNPAAQLAIPAPETYQRAILTTFTVPGIQFGSGGLTFASTDDFIRAARAGIVRDISVGLYGGSWVCDICGGNYRSYRSCPHLAGFEYPLGEQGERLVVATVSIDGAHLSEHSAVYDGATPGATIRKANRLAAAGELEPKTVELFEARYKIELPRRVQSSGVDLKKDGRQKAAEPKRGGNMDLEQLIESIRGIVQEVREPNGEPLDEAVRWLVDEVARLTPLADDGRAYRNDLVTEALAEGVRAMGENFAQETYEATLRGASIETIKRMRDDWRAIGDANFPSGRQTVNEEEGGEVRVQTVPDSAYQA